MPRAIPAPREYARVRERLVLRRKGGRYVIVYTCPRACTRHQCGMRTVQPVQGERAHNGEDDTSGSRRLRMALQVYGACGFSGGPTSRCRSRRPGSFQE
jgi:hypothetical protein